MFLFFWLEKKIRGGSIEETLERMKKEQLKKGLHYTQQSHIKSLKPVKQRSASPNAKQGNW
jgi:hypothetical protein